MEDLDHPALIEEWKQNIDADAYENNLNKDVKIPSIKKNLIVIIKLILANKHKGKSQLVTFSLYRGFHCIQDR